MPHNISAALIVRNEAENLAACLESIRGLDEIVIVDTGSEDNTVEIAYRYTDKVFRFDWIDDFAAARNCADTKCSGDYIFSIDADEILEPGGVNKLRDAVLSRLMAYAVKIDAPSSYYYKVRLYRNIPEVRWIGKVHNRMNVPGKVIDARLLTGYSQSHQKDPDRALRMLHAAVADGPEQGRAMYFLGREYAVRHDWDKAIIWLRRHFAVGDDPQFLCEAAMLLAKIYRVLEQPHLSRSYATSAFAINQDYREAAEFMAMMSSGAERRAWIEIAGEADNSGVRYIQKRSWLEVIDE